MQILPLDIESTIFQKGNPYSQVNKLCLLGIGKNIYDIEYSDHSYVAQLVQIQDILNEKPLLILFNAKFDLAWIRRYGLDFSSCGIWDCQLAHFILTGQQKAYPSLNEVAAYYGLGTKLDTIKEDYWEKGIDTPDVPRNILYPYLAQDLVLTEQIYWKQQEHLKQAPNLLPLINISMQDLVVLQEMEWNGIKMDFQGMEIASLETQLQIYTIKETLYEYFNTTPRHLLNLNSGDCLSALLYGGIIKEDTREANGVFKSGAKQGQDKYKSVLIEHLLPRRFEPPKGSELKKEGFFATNEETLRNIKAKKEDRKVLDNLLSLSKLEKLDSTYYTGLINLHEEKDWEQEVIHGQFNQVVARTGRLSSNAPNLQNFPPEIDSYIISRF